MAKIKWVKKHFKMVSVVALLSLLAGCASNKVEVDVDGGRHEYNNYNAPKVIESEDITEFNCDFNSGLYDYDSGYEYPDVLKIKQMCEALGGISTKTGYKMLRENKIESIKVGREYCITKVNIVDF